MIGPYRLLEYPTRSALCCILAAADEQREPDQEQACQAEQSAQGVPPRPALRVRRPDLSGLLGTSSDVTS